MTARKHFSKEFKLDAISLVQEQGYSKDDAARSQGINANVLGRWVKEHEAADGQAFRGGSDGTVNRSASQGQLGETAGWTYAVQYTSGNSK